MVAAGGALALDVTGAAADAKKAQDDHQDGPWAGSLLPGMTKASCAAGASRWTLPPVWVNEFIR